MTRQPEDGLRMRPRRMVRPAPARRTCRASRLRRRARRRSSGFPRPGAAETPRRPHAPRKRRGARRARRARTVMPAAIAWPPPLTISPRSAASRTSRPRSKPATERPEPVPMPLALKAMAKAGRRAWSFSREAISPTMPGCQLSARRDYDGRTRAAGELGVGLGAGLGEHLLLHRLALLVEPVERLGDRSASTGSSVAKQPAAQRRIADAPAGVDARADAGRRDGRC